MAIGNTIGSTAGAITGKEKKTTTTATPKTATSGVSYDKNIDYSAAIQNAVNQGDIYQAAILEQQRNAKIDGEGITGYEKTNRYSDYLPGGSKYTSGIAGMVQGSGYQNPYQDEIDRLMNEINNSQFTYDPNNAQAQALKQQYTEAGQQAMENTLAQVSARTGGLASSYAGTAAQQQYNQYMLGLDDALAANEQQARQNYLAELDAKRANLNLLAGLAAQGESSYWNQKNYENMLSQQEIENIMAAQQYKDSLAYQQWQQNLTEQQWALQQKQYEDSLLATDREYAYQTAMGILQTGNMPSAEMLQAAGLSSADAQLLANYYKQQAVLAAYRGSSGGGSGKKKEESYTAPWLQAYADGIRTEDDAISYFIAKGYTLDESAQLASSFVNALENGTFGTSGSGGSTSGMDQGKFDLMVRSIQTSLSQPGNKTYVDGYIGTFWDKLSDAQKNQLNRSLAYYGMTYAKD